MRNAPRSLIDVVTPTLRRPPAFGASALAILTVIGCAAPWIFQGLDFTDDGFHLTNQQTLLRRTGIPAGSWGLLVWGSDLVGAGWMASPGGAGLLGARIGWVLLSVGTAAVSLRILARGCGAKRAAIAVALAAPMLLAHGRMLIDYNGVPTLFMLLSIDAVGIGGQDPPPWRDVAAGVFLLLATMSRWPAAPAILAVGIVTLRSCPAANGRRRARGLRMAVGFVATALLGVMWLGASAHGRELMAVAGFDEVRGTHAFGGLARAVIRDGISIVMVAAAGVVVARVLARARSTPRGIAVVTEITFAAILSLTGTSIAADGPATTAARWTIVLAGACVAVLGGALIVRRNAARAGTVPDERAATASRLLLLGLVVGLAACVGSDTGFAKMNRGLWLAAPAAILIGGDLVGRAGRWRSPARALVLGLALAGLAIRAVSSYRDGPDRLRLTATIDHPRLRGIRTTPERARSVGEFVRALDGRVNVGDAVLAYGNTPLVQFLTEGAPALGHAWPDRLDAEEIGRRLASLGRERPLPGIVVRARCNTNDPAWPDEGRAARAAIDHDEGRRLIDDWLVGHAYATVWANSDFEILAR